MPHQTSFRSLWAPIGPGIGRIYRAASFSGRVLSEATKLVFFVVEGDSEFELTDKVNKLLDKLSLGVLLIN